MSSDIVIKYCLVSSMGAIIVNIKYCEFSIWPFELNSDDVVSVRYIELYPVFCIKLHVDPCYCPDWRIVLNLFIGHTGL